MLLCFEQISNDANQSVKIVRGSISNNDQSVEINHNRDWPYISDHPYRNLIIGGSGSRKTNALLNLIKKSMTKF